MVDVCSAALHDDRLTAAALFLLLAVSQAKALASAHPQEFLATPMTCTVTCTVPVTCTTPRAQCPTGPAWRLACPCCLQESLGVLRATLEAVLDASLPAPAGQCTCATMGQTHRSGIMWQTSRTWVSCECMYACCPPAGSNIIRLDTAAAPDWQGHPSQPSLQHASTCSTSCPQPQRP